MIGGRVKEPMTMSLCQVKKTLGQ
ncbi:hypothetical protein Godav_013167 [Gossypium davidsonii]|uniref:Uncharacterized protein n=2 Tax=Gossypium TaxID=3633 RepID=A0A7J8RFR5_GOSDV|nr:hypothetical protein [Gossypium davidsonii]MBA0647752.1 hypothetical protein [Gossypium klotzschianum]